MTDTPTNGQRHVSRQRALSREVRALYEVPELQPRLERFRAVHDPLDLREELDMARALFEEYLVTYQQQNEWGRAWQQAMVAHTAAPPPPLKWLSLEDATKYLKVIGDLTRVIQGLRMQDVMSKQEVKFKIYQLARVVESVVQETQVDEGWREHLLRTIKERWLEIWI